MKPSLLLIVLFMACNTHAETNSSQVTPSPLTLSEPSVEDNIIAMDTDHNGMVTIEEMRIYVQAKHGSSYQSDTLKKMEAAANSRSCSSPFSRSFY